MYKYNLKTLFSYLPLGLLLLGLMSLNMRQSIKIFTVERKIIPISNYFSGTVNPIEMINVVSPFDGVVSKVIAKYGDAVHKNDTLFLITSSELESTFRTTLESYIKAKSSFQNIVFQNTGNTELYKAGLISKSAFRDSEDQFKNSQLALWDSERELKKILVLAGISNGKDIEKLPLSNINEIQAMLNKTIGDMKILAPSDGILLFPSKGSDSGNQEGFTQGVGVKKGEVLALIADMSGLDFKLSVNETKFQDVKVGQKATIVGPAFQELPLTGFVESINHEANNLGQSSIPTYTIHVRVPKMTAKQHELIQVGMSASITLTKNTPPVIMIPIKALIQKGDDYFVKVINKQDRTTEERKVTPGLSDVDSIQIQSGLNPGDEIVLSD